MEYQNCKVFQIYIEHYPLRYAVQIAFAKRTPTAGES